MKHCKVCGSNSMTEVCDDCEKGIDDSLAYVRYSNIPGVAINSSIYFTDGIVRPTNSTLSNSRVTNVSSSRMPASTQTVGDQILKCEIERRIEMALEGMFWWHRDSMLRYEVKMRVADVLMRCKNEGVIIDYNFDVLPLINDDSPIIVSGSVTEDLFSESIKFEVVID
jgi:hypothetical protein